MRSRKFVDVPGGFLYYPRLGFRDGMCFLLNAELRIFGPDVGYQRSVALRTRRLTSHLGSLSRRCIAITAVAGNAILVAVQINRDVAAYFGQPTEA